MCIRDRLGREESLFGEVDRKRILHRQEYVVETVCNDLEREGYFVQPVVIPACAVGAPHRRDRVFFIAHRADAGVKVCNENGKTTFYPVGLLPTPRAVEVVEHPMKAAARTKDRTGTKLNNLSSGAAFGLLPTPMASDATTGAIIGKNDQFRCV